MKIRCGHCKEHHDSVADVRTCASMAAPAPSASGAKDASPRPAPGRPQEAAADGSETPSAAECADLVNLLKTREVPKRYRDALKAYLESEGLTVRGIREAISRVGRMPYKVETKKGDVRQPVDSDGMYRTPEGFIYKVQRNVAQGDGTRMYAKLLVVDRQPVYRTPGDPTSGIEVPAQVRFDYAPNIIRRLDARWRLTIDQAKEFGALYGTCVRCGRTLTAEDSIERMMGRTCYGRMLEGAGV